MTDDQAPPQWLEVRERHARERAERVVARRAVLDLVPGNLRDLDAAAECECSCHPQPGRDPHHGLRCTCQLSARARKARSRKAWSAFAEIGDQLRPAHERHRRELAEAAAELGVEVREEVIAAPWVITGTVEGVGFYLRERWGSYDIVIATGPDPSVQPWGAADDVPSMTIRSGREEDIYIGTPPDYRQALRFVVTTIREYLERAICPHPARPGDRYCPHCGERLSDPAVPSATPDGQP